MSFAGAVATSTGVEAASAGAAAGTFWLSFLFWKFSPWFYYNIILVSNKLIG